MTKSDEKAVSVLNELIEICEDGAKGFSSASDGVQDAGLRMVLKQYSVEREQFASELQREVRGLGANPKASGSVGGALHRGWIDLKAAVTGKDDHAIMVECERGEDAAKEAYEKAISGSDLPGNILPIVQRQFEKIKEAHDNVRDIRDHQTSVAK